MGRAGSRIIRALTWMVSGFPLGMLPPSNTESRLAMEPDLSRGTSFVSGEDSLES